MNAFQEIMKRRKGGDHEGALEMGRKYVRNSPDDIWYKRALAWVLYDRLKGGIDQGKRKICLESLEEIHRIQLPQEEELFMLQVARQIGRILRLEGQKQRIDVKYLREILELVFALSWKKPSEAWSAMLESLLSCKGNWTDRLDYLIRWDVQWLRKEDFQMRVNQEGRKYISLAESAYGGLTKGWLDKITHTTNWKGDAFISGAIQQLILQLGELEKSHPEFQYTAYYKARLVREYDDGAKAIEGFLPFVTRNSEKTWAWELLGDLYEKDSRVAIVCYGRGLLCRNAPEFLLACRLKLVRILIAQGDWCSARYELEEIIRVREDMGWPIPPIINIWIDDPEYKKAEKTNSNKEFYKRCKVEANKLLEATTQTEIVLVQYVNNKNHLIHIVREGDMTGFIKVNPEKFPLAKGDLLKIQIINASDTGHLKCHDIRKGSFEEIPGLTKSVKGGLRIPRGATYGFVEDVYVPSNLLDGINWGHGINMNALAYRSFDKKKNSWGWTALSIKPIADV